MFHEFFDKVTKQSRLGRRRRNPLLSYIHTYHLQVAPVKISFSRQKRAKDSSKIVTFISISDLLPMANSPRRWFLKSYEKFDPWMVLFLKIYNLLFFYSFQVRIQTFWQNVEFQWRVIVILEMRWSFFKVYTYLFQKRMLGRTEF